MNGECCKEEVREKGNINDESPLAAAIARPLLSRAKTPGTTASQVQVLEPKSSSGRLEEACKMIITEKEHGSEKLPVSPRTSHEKNVNFWLVGRGPGVHAVIDCSFRSTPRGFSAGPKLRTDQYLITLKGF